MTRDELVSTLRAERIIRKRTQIKLTRTMASLARTQWDIEGTRPPGLSVMVITAAENGSLRAIAQGIRAIQQGTDTSGKAWRSLEQALQIITKHGVCMKGKRYTQREKDFWMVLIEDMGRTPHRLVRGRTSERT